MLRPVFAHTLTVILAVVAAVGCVGHFDFNLVLALGWIYLSYLNPRLTSSLGVLSTSFLVLPHDSWLAACRHHNNQYFGP